MQKNKETAQKHLSKSKLALETVLGVVKELKESGNLRVSKNIAAKRRKVCNMCPELIKGKCKVCGCFVNLKTELVAARCPLGHWNAKIMEEAMTGHMGPIPKSSCCG